MLTFNDEDTSRWCRIARGISMPDQSIKASLDATASTSMLPEPVVDREVTLGRLRAVMAMGEVGDAGWERRRQRLESWRKDQEGSVPSIADSPPSPVPELEDEPVTSAGDQAADMNACSLRIQTGWHGVGGTDGFDERLGGGLVSHGVHEWIGDASDRWQDEGEQPRRTKRVGSEWLPHLGPICAVVHRIGIARREQGLSAPTVAWIGRCCRPTSWSLVPNRRPVHPVLEPGSKIRMAVSPEPVGSLLSRTLVVQPPGDRVECRRWILEHAIRNPGIDVAVTDGRGFSPLDTRRLQVAMAARRDAGRAPITVMIVRPPEDLKVRSAATTRWSVRSRSSCFSSGSVGSSPRHESPGWQVRLCRVRMPQAIGMNAARHQIVAEIFPDWDRPGPGGGGDRILKDTMYNSSLETTDHVATSRPRIHASGRYSGVGDSTASAPGAVVSGSFRGDPPSILRSGSRSSPTSTAWGRWECRETRGARRESLHVESGPKVGADRDRSGSDGSITDSAGSEGGESDGSKGSGASKTPGELITGTHHPEEKHGRKCERRGDRVPRAAGEPNGEGLLFSGAKSGSPGGNGGG